MQTTDAYNTGGELASSTTGGGDVTSYTYYADGQVESQSDTSGDTTSYAYDLLGDTVKTTLPDGSMETAAYDGAGRQTGTAAESPSGTVLTSTSAAYSADGYATASTDADGYTETYAYDALGDLTQQTEPVSASASITTGFGYDANGSETALTDGNGNSTYYTYNSLGLPESVTRPATAADPSDNTATTSYTADGQVSEVQLPGGVVQDYAYDALDDLTSETGSGASAATVCRDYQYDLDQNVVAAGCSTGTGAGWEYPTWNALGENLGNTGQAGSSSFAYTPDGQLASRTDASGTSTFTYDNDDREATDSDPLSGQTLSYTYNALSQPATITYGSGGNVRTFAYNPEHELASDTIATPGGSTIGSISYAYDDDGQLTGETTAGLADAGTQSFAYDEDGRLISWTNTPDGGTAATTGYTYDDDGNRLTAGSTSYTYNAQDELTADGSNTYAYTDDGDLASVTNDTTQATFSYTSDAFGQQISERTETDTYDAYGRAITAGSASLTYADLGNDIASTAGGPFDGSETTTYSRDANGQLVSDLQSAYSESARFIWTNQHGDVVGYFADGSDTTLGSEAFDPWGNPISWTGHHTDLAFQGEYTDSANGSGGTPVLMGARWYDPSAGEFQNADTMANDPTPRSVDANLYAYAADSPLDNVDLDGHSWWSDALNDAAMVGLVAVDALDQEVPGLDVVTDAATVEEGAEIFDLGDDADEAWSADDSDGGGDGSYESDGDYEGEGYESDEEYIRDDERELSQSREKAQRERAGEEQAEQEDEQEREERAEEEHERYEHHIDDEHEQFEKYEHEKFEKEQRAKAEAAKKAKQEKEAAEQRAKAEAEKKAAEQKAAQQKKIDERDAKASAGVGKSRVEKGAPGSVGGRGGLQAAAGEVGATPDVMEELAGEEASQQTSEAAADEVGQGDGSGAACGGQSFAAGTPVLLGDGKTAPISSLKKGDKVEAADTRTGKDQSETVTAVLVHHDTDLYDLTVKTPAGSEVIHTTSSHLFWDPYLDHGWIPANHLKPGMHLKTPDGQSAVVVGGSVPAVHDGWMWDLTVPGDNDHDFYVTVNGGTGVLVHNENEPCSVSTLRDYARQINEAGVHPAAVNMRVIAVGQDEAGNLTAASSDNFDIGQRAMADELGIRRVPTLGTQHAEENLITDNQGSLWSILRIGTYSQDPCLSCSDLMDQLGIEHG